ncbi:hypothetical protein [Streptomyces sp900116325]
MRAQEKSRWSTRRVDALVTITVIALGVVDSWVKPSVGCSQGYRRP